MAFACERRDDGEDAFGFKRDRNGVRARTRRFPADIEDVGALLGEHQAMDERFAGAGKETAIRK